MSERVIFRLSNRQRKDLYVNGRELRICLPLSLEDEHDAQADPLALAARRLPDVDETIQAAQLGTITVELPPAKLDGLNGSLGYIVHDDHLPQRRDSLLSRMRVLIVTLAHGATRHSVGLRQWPGKAVVDGQSVPPVALAADRREQDGQVRQEIEGELPELSQWARDAAKRAKEKRPD